jgi:hypothetical protein
MTRESTGGVRVIVAPLIFFFSEELLITEIYKISKGRYTANPPKNL